MQSATGDSVSALSPSRVITRGTLRGVEAALRLSVSGQAPLSVEQISLVNTADHQNLGAPDGLLAGVFRPAAQ